MGFRFFDNDLSTAITPSKEGAALGIIAPVNRYLTTLERLDRAALCSNNPLNAKAKQALTALSQAVMQIIETGAPKTAVDFSEEEIVSPQPSMNFK